MKYNSNHIPKRTYPKYLVNLRAYLICMMKKEEHINAVMHGVMYALFFENLNEYVPIEERKHGRGQTLWVDKICGIN